LLRLTPQEREDRKEREDLAAGATTLPSCSSCSSWCRPSANDVVAQITDPRRVHDVHDDTTSTMAISIFAVFGASRSYLYTVPRAPPRVADARLRRKIAKIERARRPLNNCDALPRIHGTSAMRTMPRRTRCWFDLCGLHGLAVCSVPSCVLMRVDVAWLAQEREDRKNAKPKATMDNKRKPASCSSRHRDLRGAKPSARDAVTMSRLPNGSWEMPCSALRGCGA